jgi:hypothetical protein
MILVHAAPEKNIKNAAFDLKFRIFHFLRKKNQIQRMGVFLKQSLYFSCIKKERKKLIH